MMTMNYSQKPAVVVKSGPVHCAMCTHTVEAEIVSVAKRSFVKAGQHCPRCGSSLDAAYVLSYDRAA
jgi:uncharacterized protein (UPF0212 family)